MSDSIPESIYVALVEFALFLLGGAGLLQVHSEKSCVRRDEVECLEAGPTYYAVAYGMMLTASAAGLALMAMSLANAVLVNERQHGTAEGLALAALHWQFALSSAFASTLLGVWGCAGRERRALFAVLVRTGVNVEENEYLTKLWILCSFVVGGFLLAFCVVLYVGLSRQSAAPARSTNMHSLSATTLLLSVFMQHWLSAYRQRVCENVAAAECMPELARIRAGWFVEDYGALFEAAICLAVVALSDVVGVKARGVFEATRRHKAICLMLFILSRAGVGVVLGGLVLWQLCYDIPALRIYNITLWGLGLLCTLADVVRFLWLPAEQQEAPEPAEAGVLSAIAFGMPASRRLMYKRRKTDNDKKMA